VLRIGFRVKGERYALLGRHVVEVIPRVVLRRMPLAPPSVAGLFTYRGVVTPVVDLCQLLAGEPCPDRLSSRVIVVRLAGQRLIGLLAERVTDVLSDDTPAQPGLALPDAPFLVGVVRTEDGLVPLVEPEKLLPESLFEILMLEGGPA